MNKCKICKKELVGNQKSTCSWKCRSVLVNSLNKGKPSPFKGKTDRWSLEQRKKIGDSQKGRKMSESFKRQASERMKGKPGFFKGKKHTEEWKENMSLNQSGEKHYNWQGGKSFEPYSVDWTNTLKRSIRERDFYTCQICKEPQGDIALAVHHIDYDKKNCNPINLIALCCSCHTKTNHNRDYWKKYFSNNYQIRTA